MRRPDGKRIIEVDPNVAPFVVRVFELYSAGNLSVKEVARKAKEEGLVFRGSGKPVPTSTIHKILRNPIYTGRFSWKGKLYKGAHAPLVENDVWEMAQMVRSTHRGKRHRTATHDFAFSGFVTCGHCGCGLVGEKKKDRYVYYHCTGYKGKCPEPYVREERLAEEFETVLEQIIFDDNVITWVAEALKQSHADEKKFHDEAVARLQAEYTRLQGRIDQMYIDKLDGRVTLEFFDRKASEWRLEQDNLLRTIANHQSANRTYVDEGARLLELASRACDLYAKQTPHEKRRLLDCVVAKASWKAGALEVTYRPPFDLLALSNSETAAKDGRKHSRAPFSEIMGG
ncbi:MAG: recombinase family protein [Deltaproteobacteria bacterium]|nr:recombinase family protein [Deltaproteobacteria bacterium]